MTNNSLMKSDNQLGTTLSVWSIRLHWFMLHHCEIPELDPPALKSRWGRWALHLPSPRNDYCRYPLLTSQLQHEKVTRCSLWPCGSGCTLHIQSTWKVRAQPQIKLKVVISSSLLAISLRPLSCVFMSLEACLLNLCYVFNKKKHIILFWTFCNLNLELCNLNLNSAI